MLGEKERVGIKRDKNTESAAREQDNNGSWTIVKITLSSSAKFKNKGKFKYPVDCVTIISK